MTDLADTALLFPGQGSQQVGMLAELATEWPQIKTIFADASETLGWDLWQLTQQGPQETLNLTANAQPALLSASYALWQVLKELGYPQPAMMAGHSLGEWSALVCSGSLAFADGVKLVHLRGLYMQEAVPVGEGGMAAIIGLSDEAIEACCADAAQGQQVMAVNYNSPGQVVIAGHSEAVNRAMNACKEAGAKRALPLAVSAPFHTPLMKPAAERLAEQISATEFLSPQVPIVHNVHGQCESDPNTIKRLMVEQIYSPVQWVRCVETLKTSGVTKTVECGPGKVLSGLVKRIDKSFTAASLDSVAAVRELVSAN